MARFTAFNTDHQYNSLELAQLNAAFEAIIESNRACGADWDFDSIEQKSWEDSIAEGLLADYEAA